MNRGIKAVEAEAAEQMKAHLLAVAGLVERHGRKLYLQVLDEVLTEKLNKLPAEQKEEMRGRLQQGFAAVLGA